MPFCDPHSKHVTDTVLMVAPHDFEFNEQTSQDNEFQHRPTLARETVNQRAMAEFAAMVESLRAHKVTVLVPEPRLSGNKTPDAVFPNNWICTEHDGTVVLFPMASENRRSEKRMREIEETLGQAHFYIRNVVNIGRINETQYFLEGTGSMIIDHNNRIIYAARSVRCHPTQFENFLRVRGYERGILFDTASRSGLPIYHTNVMMSIGERFAVICSASIPDAAERREVLSTLGRDHEIIDISLQQVEESFCGNILQLRGSDHASLIVMSHRALSGFTPAQTRRLEEHGTILPMGLETIESVGGGSARCMLAEIFLPRAALA